MAEEQRIEKTLREKDPAEWKAQRSTKAQRRAQIRRLARLAGIRLGRWQGGVAVAKNRQKTAAVIGNAGERFQGYTLLDRVALEAASK